MEIYNLDAALFTRMVDIGEKKPDGEANYEGYSRVRFAADTTQNLGEIEFPRVKSDYKDVYGNFIPIMCIAAIDGTETVVGVKSLSIK